MTVSNETNQLSQLPLELIDEVARYLDIRSFARFTATCRRLRAAEPSCLKRNREASLFRAVRTGDHDTFRKEYAALKLWSVRSLPGSRHRDLHHLLHACQWVLAIDRRDPSPKWWGPISQLANDLYQKDIPEEFSGIDHCASHSHEFSWFPPKLMLRVVADGLLEVVSHQLSISSCCNYHSGAYKFALATTVCRQEDEATRHRLLPQIFSFPGGSIGPEDQSIMDSFHEAVVATQEVALIFSVLRRCGAAIIDIWRATLSLDAKRHPHILALQTLLFRTHLAAIGTYSNEPLEGLTIEFPQSSSQFMTELDHEYLLHGVDSFSVMDTLNALGNSLLFDDFLGLLLGTSNSKRRHGPNDLTVFLSHVHLHLHTLHTLPFNKQCKLTSASLQQLLNHIPIDVAGLASHTNTQLKTPSLLDATRCARCAAIAKTILASPEFSKNPALVRMAETDTWTVSYDPISPETRLAEARALAEVLRAMDREAQQGAGAAAAAGGSPWYNYLQFALSDQLVELERLDAYFLDWRGGGKGINTPDLATLAYIYCRGGRFDEVKALIEEEGAKQVKEREIVLDATLMAWVHQCFWKPHKAIVDGFSTVEEEDARRDLAEMALLLHKYDLVDPEIRRFEEFVGLIQWAELESLSPPHLDE